MSTLPNSVLVSPLDGLSFPSIGCSFSGITCPIGFAAEVNTLLGAFTVKLDATAVEGSTCAVRDAQNNAAANAITVDGNGNTIDGNASVSLSTSGVDAIFVFDRGEWKRTLPPRRIATLGPFTTAADVGAAVPPTPLAGAGQPPTSIQLGDATTVGVSAFAARSDHKHKFPADQYALQSVNAVGVTGLFVPVANQAYVVKLTGVAQEAGGAGGAAIFERTLLVRNPGGAPVIDVAVANDQPNGTTWSLTAVVAGPAIAFVFTGEAAKTINLALDQLSQKVA